MDQSHHLKMPYIMAAQAQRHITHNEALAILDALVQLAVIDRDLATPPASPAEGDRYLIAGSATEAWSGKTGQIAHWQDGAWQFLQPNPGFVAWVIDETRLTCWTGTAWQDIAPPISALQNLNLLGIGSTADAVNPFSAKLNKALWTAKSVGEGGDGDLRYVLNKETAADVLSLLMQTGYSGRAEFGLIGNDDVALKVSPDGSTWTEAIAVDRNAGGVRFLAGSATVASAATCNIGAAAALKVAISGTTTITSFGTVANAIKLVSFQSALTLTHNATRLILPGAANIVTAANDTAIATSDASGNWTVRAYQRADGKAVTPPSMAELAGGNAGGRRNAFINPFFDVAQAYSSAATFSMNGGHLPIDMVRAETTGGGGSWRAELVDFAAGQTEVPGNPQRFLRVTELTANDGSGAPGIRFVVGPASTLSGEIVTLSFYARVQTGTLALAASLNQDFGSGGSAAVTPAGISSTPNLTTTWQRFSVSGTLASISGKTLGSGNALSIRLARVATPKTFNLDICGVQLERGSTATELNAVARIEAEELCRRYFERVAIRAVNGTIWAPCTWKRSVPAVSQTGATSVANASNNGCQLSHSADAAAIVTFDARL